jgi:glutaminyl-tRNA synthetase
VPPPGFKRLTVGGDVRLRGAGIIRCDEVVKDAGGKVVELRCTLDPESRPGMEGANRKVKGTIHWVSAKHAVACGSAAVRPPVRGRRSGQRRRRQDLQDYLNPGLAPRRHRLRRAGRGAGGAGAVVPVRAHRLFRRRPLRPSRDAPVFNRSVTLRDTWSGKKPEQSRNASDCIAASCAV